MKKLFFASILCLLATTFIASAQTSPVPEHYVFSAKEDYAKYNDNIIKTIDWLQQSPWSQPLDNRKPANAFLMAWLTGTPDVSISIGSSLTKLVDKNPEMLIIFMGGYTKYALQHKNDFNKDLANAAGLRAMIDKYTNDPARKKDSAMEKLIKIDKDGKLDEWAKTDYLKS
ncbi:MAG TPA: hypothetical protein VFE54_02685 [Mucilaginibacter sp.]|jgi:hypothetical protein|nr:hypothetical protein [Mucilaginibacter sp.]